MKSESGNTIVSRSPDGRTQHIVEYVKDTAFGESFKIEGAAGATFHGTVQAGTFEQADHLKDK